MENSMTKLNAIKCPKCLDMIYSRARHDYHFCSCGNESGNPLGISVDGGFDYLHYGWANDIKQEEIEHVELFIPVSKRELFDDWNFGRNKFGKMSDKLGLILDWFWNKVEDMSDYELFLQVYGNSDRNEIIEQLYCMDLYANRKK